MSPTLARNLHWDKEDHDFDIYDLVKSASRVIAPLGPINTFAARSPWAEMEEQPFEQVARKFKSLIDLDLYPLNSVVQSAWKRGEINEELLEARLQLWLDSQSFELSSTVTEEFCRNSLKLEPTLESQLSETELKNTAKKLKVFSLFPAKKQLIRTYSQQQILNRHMIKWCKLFLDESGAVWSMPNQKESFYQAWKRLVSHDPALSRKLRKQLNSILPKEANVALKDALLELNIPEGETQNYLESHLLALPGWAGMMLWRSQQSSSESNLLADYLAVRLSLERVLLPLPKEESGGRVLIETLLVAWAQWGGLPLSSWTQLSSLEQRARLTLAYRFDSIVRNRLWLEAWEKTYEEGLKKVLTSEQPSFSQKVESAKAQFVFCIDVRSEPFRRKIEQAGYFETFGTAGFFGLPIETCKLGSHHTHSSLPVMFKPQYKVNEVSADLNDFEQREYAANSLGSAFKAMKHNVMSSLVLPEISGPWMSLQTLARSFVPRSTGKAIGKLRRNWLRKPSPELTIDRAHYSEAELPVGFSEKEKVHYAGQALKMMGLTGNFSPLVVICGHGSHSTNNPYSAALDCGACGGASSGFNARVLAALCNLQSVREALRIEGIYIPNDTVFAAAEHITTLDELRWLYVPELSDLAQAAFEQVEAVLPHVREEANAERIPKLPNLGLMKKPQEAAERLAEDWSEVRPEWGLARNAAFIIGDRSLTKNRNLDGRAFLQNYNWQKDKSGKILSNIIAGPATVAEWINLQYYASTVAPHYYGSGNKATQTVTAGIGVMQGNASDLLSGLPWQSVMKSDGEAYHEPLRLLVVIQAPKEFVKRVLDQDAAFRQKVQGGWVRLASIGPEGIWVSWSC